MTGTKAELRARAEALAAEYDAPLPDGDVGLIEAERRFRDFRAGEKALYRDFRITIEAEGIVNPIIEPVRLRLWGFIEQTPPIGLAGAAAKLRLLTDKDLGLSAEISEGEDTNLKQVGEFVEREAGATANPDEVAAPALTDDVIEETFEVVTSMGNDLMDASVLADGVTILAADSIEDQQLGAVLMRLARGIADHCKAVEERRGELFRLLHPNRKHFEKEGVAGGGAAMSAAKLFRNWLALREAEHCRGQDDEEVERLTDEMIAIERAILAADPATAEDEQAQVAILAYYAVHEAPYANYEVLDRCYQRLVIDRLSDPIVREREREWGRKRVERAREKLSETD